MRKVNKKKKSSLNLKDKLHLEKKKTSDSKTKRKQNYKQKNDLLDEKVLEDTNKIKNKQSKNSKSSKKTNSASKKKTSNKQNRKPKRSLWKKIVTVILILGIIVVLSITAFLGYIVITAPEFDEEAFKVKDQTVVYDINGEIITTLGTQKRESVTYDDLPQVLIDAIIATEDSRFFQHNGVDLLRFIKATVYQLIGRSEAGGASTITMQAVKNNLTKKDTVETNKIKKIVRKFQDVYLAVFKVEKEYTKEEILEFYVNDNYLGGSAYGVEEASKYYFDKSVSELTLPEAALIAGLFQLPGANNPYKNPEGATARRDLVLKYMYNHEYITKEEAELAKEVSIESLLAGANKNDAYQGYIDVVVDEVEKITGNNPYTVPMKIWTTMERSIQDGINKVLESDASYWTQEATQAGIAIVNVDTGAISAIGAGRNRTGERTFNRATDAYRQPGSTAKPIFAYGPGMEYNNFSTYTLFVDEPWSYTNGPSINNWDGTFQGLITSREALQVSRNIPALKAYQTVGSKNIQKFAYSLGLDVSLNQNSENYRIINQSTGLDNTINEAYAIGGVAEGFTPLQMASAYTGFASGGYYTDPYCVTKIEFRETGEVQEFKATKERVMSESTAYMINNILESAVKYGFSGGANVSGSHVAAKTGTTNFPDSVMSKYHLPSNTVNDLWTVAYTSKYSVAVWYGYDEVTETTYNTSSSFKDNLVRDVMKYIPKDTTGFRKPSSVVEVKVEKETWPAKLPSDNTPSNMIITECFKRGTEPTEVSARYATLNDITNYSKVSTNGNTVVISWDYTTPTVLTDEYLTKYFNQSVFGNSKEKLLNERKKYNSNTLGDIVFGIYLENEDGTLELIDSTKETTYTYTGYGETTIVIKAEHTYFKNNASNGIKFTLDLSGGNETANLYATLEGKTTKDALVGSYVEEGIKSIQYGLIDVTKKATVKYQVINGNDLNEYTTISELETAVNSLPAGNYKINYVISYRGKELTKNRTVILK